jgi:hypothetical protein
MSDTASNTNLNVSAALSNAISAVLAPISITEFTLDVQITTLDDAAYSFTPDWIDKLTITQSFAENFGDIVILEFKAAPTDYMKLFANSKGLQVALRIVYYDAQSAQRVFTPPPIARIYKAMLMDPQDLSKKYTTGSLMPTASMPKTEQHISTRIPTKLRLIESAVYTIRQQQVHGIYKTTKIADVISHIAQSFSIKQLYIIPPDNTMKWDHIVIPPAQGIDQIFDFLQYHHGVYMKGIDWYFTNSILYVYPAYENNPTIKYKADIYNAPSGSYSGLHSYHNSDLANNRLGIVSTTKVKTSDISRPAAENAGSNFSFVRASSIVDKFATTTSKGTFINNNNALTVGTTINRTASTNANNPRYTKTTDNIFEESSKLAKWSAVLIECGWGHAVPYLLYPGHSIRYHYDKNSVFTTQQGILERVVYTFSRSHQLTSGYTYSGNATLNIRADSDVTNAVQTPTL